MAEPGLDTIAAIATPVGTGGVGIVRLSGPRAVAIVAELLGKEASALGDRILTYGVVRDGAGQRLDDVLAVAMRGPRSFTGEDVSEIHAHGGRVNVGKVLAAAVDAGARHAEPGEFSRRAFMNGRLDLAQAEAILGVIEAGGERAWRMSQAALAGALGETVREQRRQIAAARAEIEVAIDFPEEGVEPKDIKLLGERIAEIGGAVRALAATYEVGRRLAGGLEVALVGPVNAGKSSLLNALVGSERALVDDSPGTTRDVVEARVVWNGVEISLLDTAGQRDGVTGVEARGMAVGARRAAAADVVIELWPADGPAMPRDEGDRRRVRVVSKADLVAGEGLGQRAIPVTSARTGAGVEALKQKILEVALGEPAEGGDGALVWTDRQRATLASAARDLETAAAGVALAPELVAADLRSAEARLSEILGEGVGDEVLDELFARFCIGK
ncbi:MAG TPA: tRNA uridine-5-carboxymethylaminomethyl(34) synthesis GTPase MnmE [Kofleriaceae bacterium]|nr:tRNA uridine-5-carboxymethylaminomethyl(34) synthesis GTPase MnmE [Kofleriaceae bacterium]